MPYPSTTACDKTGPIHCHYSLLRYSTFIIRRFGYIPLKGNKGIYTEVYWISIDRIFHPGEARQIGEIETQDNHRCTRYKNRSGAIVIGNSRLLLLFYV